MKAILLPGLHGSGQLFAPLCDRLSEHCQCVPIAYPNSEKLTYPQLTDWLLARLPTDQAYFIVAESFSGPIAYLISLAQPDGLRFVVFGASFIDNPNTTLLKARSLLPPMFKFLRYVPDNLLKRILLIKDANANSVGNFKQVLLEFPSDLFRYRLELITQSGLPRQKSPYRAIYLRPQSDYMVTEAGYRSVAARFDDLSRFDLPGSHFLFQSNPQHSAEIIINEIKRSC